MCAKPARKSAPPEGDDRQHEGQPQADIVHISEGQPGEGAPAAEAPPEESQVPPRLNGEVQPCVDSVASTITGCTDTEMKNFLATADFTVRQVALMLANRWKEICRTAEFNAGPDGNKSAKIGLAFKVELDHTNLNLMNTTVKMGFARKYSESVETQEDLRQVEFKLSGAS